MRTSANVFLVCQEVAASIMKSNSLFLFFLSFFLTFCLSISAQTKQAEFPVEGSNGDWSVDSKNRAKHAIVREFLGRKALLVKKGSHILRSGPEFSEGTIEFDVAPLDDSQFIGIMFRRKTFRNYENIYLRPFRSGSYQALQYAPAINGSSTWQLYPEFMRTIDIPRNKWTHVRVDVQASGLKVFLNRSGQPVLEVERLRGIPKKGTVGFWSRVSSRTSESWSAAFSNVSITPKTPLGSDVNRTKQPAGILDTWQAAEPIENKEGAIRRLPNLSGWKTVKAEESGLINLNRAFKPLRGRWTAFAKTNINSSEARTALLGFGYSDDITIFLNGEPIFSGINGWESRYPQYMGFAKLGNDQVFLKLNKGNNELVFAVTNQRFGWGFVAQMKDVP